MTPQIPRDDLVAGKPLPVKLRTGKNFAITLEAGGFGGTVVLRCEGRMIFHREAQTLATLVAGILPSTGRMVVDLAGVDSVDSAALGELVLTHMWAEAAGHTLMFANPRSSVRQLFETTHLSQVFEVYATVSEAMAAMVQNEVQSA